MVDKVALKYVKTREQSLLALPLGVYQHFSGIIQLTVSSPTEKGGWTLLLIIHHLQAVEQQLLDLYRKTSVLNSDTVDGSVSSRHSSPVTPAESPILPVKSSRRTLLALLYFLQEVVSSKRLSAELQRVRHSAHEALETSFADITHACIQLLRIEPLKLTQADLTQVAMVSKSLLKSLSHTMNTSEFASILTLLIGNTSAEVSSYVSVALLWLIPLTVAQSSSRCRI